MGQPLDPYANSRIEVVTKGKGTGRNLKPFMRSFALLAVAQELRANGLSAGDILVYMQMLWTAGDDLDHPVTAVRVAEKLYRTRQSVQKSIVNLQEKGVIKKEQMNQYLFTRLSVITSRRVRAMLAKKKAEKDV